MTLLERIKKHEGFRSHVYLDSKGFLSIGYGTTVGRLAPLDDGVVDVLPEGVGWSKVEASTALKLRLRELESILTGRGRCPAYLALHEPRQEARRDVLLEMAYQLGVNGLLNFKRMLKFLEAGDWLAASREVVWKNGTTRKERSALWKQTPARAEYYERVLRTGVADG